MSRTFHFNSTGEYTENDTITTINFAYVAAIYNANTTKLRDDLQLVIDTSVHPKPELVIHTTVYKLLWEYTDPLINELYKLRKTLSPYIYLQLNNSYSDRELPSIVHSGTKDSLKTAQFIQWAGLKELPFWRNKANFIHNSTEGLLFHPFIHQDEELQVFISDANRTFHLHYRNKVKVRGIDAYRFRLLDSDFRPDPNYLTGNNTPIGLIYLGVLQNPEAPVYGSKPHFLDCDESLHKAVEGISPPNRNRDDILADIEPITGSSLRLHQRIQLLINVSQTSGHFKSFHHITPVYFPLFYLDEYATLDEKLAAKLNEMVFTPIKTVHTGVWVLFGLCCFISLTTGLCTIRWCANLCKYGDWVEERRPLILQKTDS
ncbi:lysosome membrane protein 2-like isoform X2 [Dysidea avara]